jgi:hypothetical protein
MRLSTPARGAALVAGAALTVAAVAAAVVFSSLGSAAATAAGATASSTTAAASEPIVTPIAAALVPGPIDIDRNGRSNVVTARIDFKAGDTTGWHFHPVRSSSRSSPGP